ncbi:ABC transporter ATP-binding protein [Inquilinus sp. CAU 1745]|uniref:ABC transporter ATP-binding protein n=1 Tax=Inquilinus sp. CAU 1745 TaxID=3140369 RepID=UPI00325B6BDC
MTVDPSAGTVLLDAVTKRFGAVVAVDDVSLTIEAGTLVTLLGPSGCGKTTTLRLIAGLELPSAGRVVIGGEDVTTVAADRRDIAMVFQSYALFPHMTVLDNVAYGLTVGRTPRRQAHEAARATLAQVGLEGYDDRLPSELSGGQQQRVAVARALVLEPKVLLFDEPLSNLDAKLRRQVRQDIRDLQQRLALTVVYVTHDQEEALAVSDRIVVMQNGRIAQEGSPRDLYETPGSRFVADFIGDANLVPGRVERSGEGGPAVRVGGLLLKAQAADLPDGAVTVALRPEAIALHREPAADRLTATVKSAAYLGTHMEYFVATEVGDLFITDGDVVDSAAPGTTVHLSLSGHGAAIVPE